MSGCLLSVPVAEQGASKSTASNFSLGFHEVPSAFTILIFKFNLFTFSINLLILFSLISTEVTFFPAFANWAAFPPGAEHKSTIFFDLTLLIILQVSSRQHLVSTNDTSHLSN